MNFTCTACGGTFEQGRPDAEAKAESALRFPGYDGPLDVVCEDCFRKLGLHVQWPTSITPELQEILGMPNFRCSPIAHAFRANGEAIPPKSEAEQAFVLFWLVGLALEHGPDWRGAAAAKIEELMAGMKAKAMALGEVEAQPE
jgi:hypothetical protein